MAQTKWRNLLIDLQLWGVCLVYSSAQRAAYCSADYMSDIVAGIIPIGATVSHLRK
ncbi:hypothetical protein J3492_08550 [Psychrobacter sp. F1192]|uniref:Uncharacterized protein n=1 Tax=Psychrobacter coccoides TaxID=2818440 RepID=A0ABS3NPD0_9GAMM|nr:hypothetical protein [Psychrobacter coccoides]MBO1531262.1 hypothetical protein [Psychrobacter coccoides]